MKIYLYTCQHISFNGLVQFILVLPPFNVPQTFCRLPMSSLSKFAVCLTSQQLQNSPLMGRITSILDQKLSTIDEARWVTKTSLWGLFLEYAISTLHPFFFSRVLTSLMISVSNLVSPRLRDALIIRAKQLLATTGSSNYTNPRRMVQFMRNVRYMDRALLETCNKIFLRNISSLDAENISIILGLYQSLQFNNCDFRLAAKERLIELMDTSTDPFSFSKLFVALAPIASMVRERSVS